MIVLIFMSTIDGEILFSKRMTYCVTSRASCRRARTLRRSSRCRVAVSEPFINTGKLSARWAHVHSSLDVSQLGRTWREMWEQRCEEEWGTSPCEWSFCDWSKVVNVPWMLFQCCFHLIHFRLKEASSSWWLSWRLRCEERLVLARLTLCEWFLWASSTALVRGIIGLFSNRKAVTLWYCGQ